MRKILVIAMSCGALLAACSGVDREGTRDEIVKSIESAGGKVDKDCVDDVFDKYSDDELKAIDKDVGDNPSNMSEASTELFNQLTECITFSS